MFIDKQFCLWLFCFLGPGKWKQQISEARGVGHEISPVTEEEVTVVLFDTSDAQRDYIANLL